MEYEPAAIVAGEIELEGRRWYRVDGIEDEA
jgi:hypothetical protein